MGTKRVRSRKKKRKGERERENEGRGKVPRNVMERRGMKGRRYERRERTEEHVIVEYLGSLYLANLSPLYPPPPTHLTLLRVNLSHLLSWATHCVYVRGHTIRRGYKFHSSVALIKLASLCIAIKNNCQVFFYLT